MGSGFGILIFLTTIVVLASFQTPEKSKRINNEIYAFCFDFADQSARPGGKRTSYKQCRNLLIEIAKKDLSQKGDALQESLYEWMKNEEHLDDILAMGIRV